MKITNIETHVIHAPFHDWNADAITRYHGRIFTTRTIVVIQTDDGLEGVGEDGGEWSGAQKQWAEKLKGTNPSRWLAHSSLSLGLSEAIYDVVGKRNEVPAYALFGQRSVTRSVAGGSPLQNRVPVSAWCVSQTPAKMAEEVKRAAAQGHTWLKYHTNHFHNIVDQTEAMQKVAPRGFKIHYDLNFDSTVEHIVNLAREMSKYPIVGAFEDPVTNEDFEGYKLLRHRTQIPIYFHHLHMGGREALLGLADGYMLGHSAVEQVIQRAGLFEAANTPFMLQNTGGNITTAFVAHMASVFKMATLHHVTCLNLYADDVVTPGFEVTAGTIAVSEEPGLGLTLDRDALERLKNPLPKSDKRALVRIQYAGQPPIYARPPVQHLADGAPGYINVNGGGYDQQVDQDYFEDDGSKEFRVLWEKTESGVAMG
ncbi:MAG: hypothetical protein O3A47_13550 [Chloroflexi bacterium]|nr:hypothetical protein [Chloroflexota bacterium]